MQQQRLIIHHIKERRNENLLKEIVIVVLVIKNQWKKPDQLEINLVQVMCLSKNNQYRQKNQIHKVKIIKKEEIK